MKDQDEIVRIVCSLYILKERLNKRVDFITLVAEAESWYEMEHVRECLAQSRSVIAEMEGRINELEGIIDE